MCGGGEEKRELGRCNERKEEAETEREMLEALTA